MKRILCINTGGPGNPQGLRMRRLTSHLHAEVIYHDLDREVSRRKASQDLWALITKGGPWDLIYQEGSGITGGACLIKAAKKWGQRFIISSGDPIGGFFEVTKGWLFGQVFGFYESLLYRSSMSFVGWTPYLTGVALHLGARRAITIEGGADLEVFQCLPKFEKMALKTRFGLPHDSLVCGSVGSLTWTPRQNYCYGLELIESLKRVRRSDLYIMIVGDGDGRARLEGAVPEVLKSRVIFTGRLSELEVVQAMNAMDIGFVTQTLDRLGSFRLTTKLPEYLACGTPIAMSPIPGFYDYVSEAGWPLPPFHPASADFYSRCAEWLDSLTQDEIQQKASNARSIAEERFDYAKLSEKFCDYIQMLLREG